MSYYNASLKHNSYAECLEEGPDRQINEKKVVEKLVGAREKNVRDHLVYQQQFVIQEKKGRKETKALVDIPTYYSRLYDKIKPLILFNKSND